MELITTYICKKGDIGVHDNMFGGLLLGLIDDAAASYASQICDTHIGQTSSVFNFAFMFDKKIVKS